jgi:hypothetical protein
LREKAQKSAMIIRTSAARFEKLNGASSKTSAENSGK